MKKFVLTGHGKFATGYKSNLETIMGDNAELIAIDFLEGMSDIDLLVKIQGVINENEGNELLFICDLLGGTPFKNTVTAALGKKNIEVVVGCNTSAILEMFLSKEMLPLSKIAEEIIKVSIKCIVRYKAEKINSDSNDTGDYSEGI